MNIKLFGMWSDPIQLKALYCKAFSLPLSVSEKLTLIASLHMVKSTDLRKIRSIKGAGVQQSKKDNPRGIGNPPLPARQCI